MEPSFGVYVQRLAARCDAQERRRAEQDYLLDAMMNDSTGLRLSTDGGSCRVVLSDRWLKTLRSMVGAVEQSLLAKWYAPRPGEDPFSASRLEFESLMNEMFAAVRVVSPERMWSASAADSVAHVAMRAIVWMSLMLEVDVRTFLAPVLVASDDGASAADTSEMDTACVDRYALPIFETTYLKQMFDDLDSGNGLALPQLVTQLTLVYCALLPADPDDRAFDRAPITVSLGNGAQRRMNPVCNMHRAV